MEKMIKAAISLLVLLFLTGFFLLWSMPVSIGLRYLQNRWPGISVEAIEGTLRHAQARRVRFADVVSLENVTIDLQSVGLNGLLYRVAFYTDEIHYRFDIRLPFSHSINLKNVRIKGKKQFIANQSASFDSTLLHFETDAELRCRHISGDGTMVIEQTMLTLDFSCADGAVLVLLRDGATPAKIEGRLTLMQLRQYKLVIHVEDDAPLQLPHSMTSMQIEGELR